jgi:hypothetical protein
VDDVLLSRNPTLVVGDDGDVPSEEDEADGDEADGDGVADACEGGSRPDLASRRCWPHGGPQMSLRIRRYSTEGERGSRRARIHRDGVTRDTQR